jgi:hypothetical protein
MWDGWGQQHEVHFEDTFQSPEVGLLNVFISWHFLSILFKISKTLQRTELEHKNFEILKLNKRNKRGFRNKRTQGFVNLKIFKSEPESLLFLKF